jgi:hypothetical protein
MAQQSFSTRKSVQAFVKETVSGVVQDMTSGTQILPLQEGFDSQPNVNTTDNKELSPSVDQKAPIVLNKNPTSNTGHYFRHSGDEGELPNYSVLVEASIGEVIEAPASEMLTITGSTAGDETNRAIIKLASSGGTEQRGTLLLIKDPVNGYSARNVFDKDGINCELLFNLAAAPLGGVALGKTILFKPTSDDSIPSLTQFIFRANGGSLETLSGLRVASMTLDANANEELNFNFSFAGTGYAYNGVRVLSTQRYIDFVDSDGTNVAIIQAGYFNTTKELADAVAAAMNLVSNDVFTVKWNNTGANKGKWTFVSDGSAFELPWLSGANTANSLGPVIGFTADDTGSLTYTSDSEKTWGSAFTADPDSNLNPLIVKNSEVLIGTQERYTCSGVQGFTMTLTNTLQDVPDVCEENGILEKILVRRGTAIDFVLTMKKHDGMIYEKFEEGDIIGFSGTFGVKNGGNWVPGRLVNVCLPEVKVLAYQVTDSNGVVTISGTLQSEANAEGLGSVFVTMG